MAFSPFLFGQARARARIVPPRGRTTAPDPEEPPPEEGLTLLTTVAVDSSSSSDQTNVFVEFGLPFAVDDLGVGERIAVYDDTTRLVTQEDGRSTDRNAKTRLTSICCLLPELAGNQTKILSVYKEAGALPSAPSKTVANLLALDTDAQCVVTAREFATGGDNEVYTAFTADFLEAIQASDTWTFGQPHFRGWFHDGALRKTAICLSFMKDGSDNLHPSAAVEFAATAFSTDEFESDIRWRFDPIIINSWRDDIGRDLMADHEFTTGIASPITRAIYETTSPNVAITVSGTSVSCDTAGTFTVNDHGRVLVDDNGMRAMINLINGDGKTCSLQEIPAEASIVSNNTLTSNATGWTLGTGWSYGSARLNCDGSQTEASAATATTTDTVREGTLYSCKFTVTRSAGSIRFSCGGTLGTVRSTAGTFTESIYAGGSGVIEVIADADFVGSIDNVTAAPRFGSRTYAAGEWSKIGFNTPFKGCFWEPEVWHGTASQYAVRHERDYLFDTRMLYDLPFTSAEVNITNSLNNLALQGNYPIHKRGASLGQREVKTNEPDSRANPVYQVVALRKLEGDVGPYVSKQTMPVILGTALPWSFKHTGGTHDNNTGLLVNGELRPGDDNADWAGSGGRPGLILYTDTPHTEHMSYLPYMLTGRYFFLRRMYCDCLRMWSEMVTFNNLGLARPLWVANTMRGKTAGDRTFMLTYVLSPDGLPRSLIGWSKDDLWTVQDNVWNIAYRDYIDDGTGHTGWSSWDPNPGPDFNDINDPFMLAGGGTANNVERPNEILYGNHWQFNWAGINGSYFHDLGVLTTTAGRGLYTRIIANIRNSFMNEAITYEPRSRLIGLGSGGYQGPTRGEAAAGTPYPGWELITTTLANSTRENKVYYAAGLYAALRMAYDRGIDDHDAVEAALEYAVTYLRTGFGGGSIDPSGTDPLYLTMTLSAQGTAADFYIAARPS